MTDGSTELPDGVTLAPGGAESPYRLKRCRHGVMLFNVNDRYIGRLKKLEEHFDICIRDLEHIKDRQLKARDDEAQWLLSENVALKNELHKLPQEKPTAAAIFAAKSDPNPSEATKTA